MFTVIRHFARVNVGDSISVAPHNFKPKRHTSVDLVRVAYIEAKPGFGKLSKNMLQLRRRSTNWLPMVHIFYTQFLPQSAPKAEIVNRIRVDDDQHCELVHERL